MSFGVIIHYGLYSYYGYDDITSAKKRNVQNGSEWYYGRLIDTNTFRPVSGQSYTKEYHKENHQDVDYFDNLDKITDVGIKCLINLKKLECDIGEKITMDTIKKMTNVETLNWKNLPR